MGAYAPVADLDEETLDDIVNRRMRPIAQALGAAGALFRGVLCATLVLTAHGPQVLDVQPTFGDSGIQTVAPLIAGDLLPALLACAVGGSDGAGRQGLARHRDAVGRREGAVVSVVLAAAGYPGTPHLNQPIAGLEAVDEPGVLLFHGATEWQRGGLTTSGGRALCVAGLGGTLRAARDRAYAAIEDISFPGMQYRRDIG
jgi:phosphoribosylamine--glycine ligase